MLYLLEIKREIGPGHCRFQRKPEIKFICGQTGQLVETMSVYVCLHVNIGAYKWKQMYWRNGQYHETSVTLGKGCLTVSEVQKEYVAAVSLCSPERAEDTNYCCIHGNFWKKAFTFFSHKTKLELRMEIGLDLPKLLVVYIFEPLRKIYLLSWITHKLGETSFIIR